MYDNFLVMIMGIATI